MPQFEAGTYPSSYIPTTTAAAARISDNARVTDITAIALNPSEFTILCEVDCVGLAGTSTVSTVPFGIRNASGIDAIRPYISNVGAGWGLYAITNNILQVNGGITGTTDPRGTIGRVAIAVRNGSLKYAGRGSSTVANLGTYVMGTFTALDIGNASASSQIGARIRKVDVLPYQYSDTQILGWVNG
jgi:hypothetical protein